MKNNEKEKKMRKLQSEVKTNSNMLRIWRDPETESREGKNRETGKGRVRQTEKGKS